jgi:hypothetical protein
MTHTGMAKRKSITECCFIITVERLMRMESVTYIILVERCFPHLSQIDTRAKE